MDKWPTPSTQLEDARVQQNSKIRADTFSTAEDMMPKYKSYAQAASRYDENRFQSFYKRLDSQLLFAGIFSAVTSPLIAESYHFLQVDNPSSVVIVMNLAFILSLVTCLITAVTSLHLKAWLDGYDVARLSHALHSSKHEQELLNACLLRQYRAKYFQQYSVASGITATGPVMIYWSLMFFFVGLISFLWELSKVIAIITTVFITFFVSIHMYTSVVPCFTAKSPYKTPLSYKISNLYRGARKGKFVINGLLEEAEKDDIATMKDQLEGEMMEWLQLHFHHED